MKILNILSVSILLALVLLLYPGATAQAQENVITPDDLIYLVNTIRTANGLPALRVDSILMYTAQTTAETMAAQNLTWHIEKPGKMIEAAGYGTGYKVWATENFAMSWGEYSITEIQQEWADATHMIPMVNPSYCDIGAGVATASDGTVYYIVHAAYTSAGACGKYQSPIVDENEPDTADPTEIADREPESTSEYIVVQGDSLWTIAVENETTIAIIKQLNGLDSDYIYVGQKLLVPAPPKATPTVTSTSTLTATAISQPGVTSTTESLSPTEPVELSLQETEFPQATATIPVANTMEIQSPVNAKTTNPVLAWQIIAGIEFIGLVVITTIFWQPWIPKKPVLHNGEEPETWNEPG